MRGGRGRGGVMRASSGCHSPRRPTSTRIAAARPEAEFAGKWNALHKVVFSTSLERAPWGSWPEGKIVRGDVAEEIARLRQMPGKDILVSGSISIAQALIAKAQVDVYRLILCPTVLGGAGKLFPDGASNTMALQRATTLDRGAVSLVYDRA